MAEASSGHATVNNVVSGVASGLPTDNGARPLKSAAIYAFDFDLEDANDSHALVVQMVGENRRVLELGCAEGSITKVLEAHGCSVTGVEIDPEAADKAAQFAERIVIADLDAPDLEDKLGPRCFDVVLAADVLEHLRDPVRCLTTCTQHLAPGGEVVMSIPNVAHGDVRLALMGGEFRYRELGLLDDTHLRFFTRSSLSDLLDECALVELEVQRVTRPIGGTEIAPRIDRYPELIKAFEKEPEARTYQFVVRAAAKSAHLALLASQRDALRQELSDSQELDPLAQVERKIADLRAQLSQSEDVRRDSHRREAGLKSELIELRTSLSWKATDPLRRLPRVLARLKRLAMASQFLAGARRLWWKHEISSSGLFDRSYYLKANPDVAASGVDPLKHYVERGAFEGRNPHRLFDSSYYLASNPAVAAAGYNPLAHYAARGAHEPRNPHPLFNARYYVASNSDVEAAGLNPLAHFWHVGADEGRCAWTVDDAIRFIRPQAMQPERAACLDYLHGGNIAAQVRPLKVALYASSQGNYFFEEIRDLLACGLKRAGAETVILNEAIDGPSDTAVDFIIAPHEFFGLGQGPSRVHRRRLRQAFMLSTEQLHTRWFAKSLPYLAQAAAVFDMNFQTAAALTQLGIPAHFLPLGWLDNFEPFALQRVLPNVSAVQSLDAQVRDNVPDPSAPLSSRPIDLLFVGGLSPRRREFFAKNAIALNRYQRFFYLSPADRPLVQGSTAGLSTAAVVGLAQRSKILMNVHRDELPYFEWHRMVCQGIWHRTLVLTEPCLGIPWLKGGEHYIECEASELPSMIDWLLNSEDGIAKAESVRCAAYEALIARYDFVPIVRAALSHVILPAVQQGA